MQLHRWKVVLFRFEIVSLDASFDIRVTKSFSFQSIICFAYLCTLYAFRKVSQHGWTSPAFALIQTACYLKIGTECFSKQIKTWTFATILTKQWFVSYKIISNFLSFRCASKTESNPTLLFGSLSWKFHSRLDDLNLIPHPSNNNFKNNKRNR